MKKLVLFQEAGAIKEKTPAFNKEDIYKKAAVVLCMIIIVFAGYKTTNEMILHNTEKAYSIHLNYGTAVPHFLLVGLNTQGEGQIHIGDLSRGYINRYFENGQDVDDAKKYAESLLVSDWSNNKEEIPKLFIKKII